MFYVKFILITARKICMKTENDRTRALSITFLHEMHLSQCYIMTQKCQTEVS